MVAWMYAAMSWEKVVVVVPCKSRKPKVVGPPGIPSWSNRRNRLNMAVRVPQRGLEDVKKGVCGGGAWVGAIAGQGKEDHLLV
eukprot:14741151-Ditylum_brightwellii.AAC.2